MTPAAQQAMALLAERSGFSPEDLATFREDPMAMLLLAAAQRQQETAAGDAEELEALEQRALTAEAQLQDARRALHGARSAIASAQALTAYVARVLGSCERCCGLNALCPACGGQGAPGYRQPDRDELLRWLQRALAHSGLTVVPASHPIPPQGGPRQ
jgi:hypothetical protein